MLWVGPDFDEPVDDDVPMDEERCMDCSNDELVEEEQSDDDDFDADFGYDADMDAQ